MKKILPKILIFFFVFFLVASHLQTFAISTQSNAAAATTNSVPAAANATPTPTPDLNADTNTWVSDPDVTFVGKTGARAGEFLDWTLQNYQWSYTPTSNVFKDKSPLETFWATIRNIVYAFLLLFILASAFILIITRGKNLTLRKFVWRFILIALLVTLSYAIIQFIYAISDIIQGFFLKNPDSGTSAGHPFISQINLLNIGFNYKDFIGYRLQDSQYDESVFVSLLLVKLTAITYYAMTGILLIRKIIMWFFIVISPIFPLLLFYSPIRNTAKIWVGEFFRWLLYAPLFAILLAGLVQVWSNFIPLQFNFVQTPVDSAQQMASHPCSPGNAQPIYQDCYTTAVNILLGGPGQSLSINNSVNYRDTFAEYVVALLMLWVVIILPFLLLQIFLDYLQSFNFSESAILKQLIASGSTYIGKSPSPAPPPPPPTSTGIARAIPFSAKIAMPLPTTVHTVEKISTSSDVLKSVNISVPTLTDIAKFESSMLSRDIASHQEISRSRETLEKLGNPNSITNPAERTQFAQLRGKLTQAKIKGDPLAASVLSAVSSVSTSSTSSTVADKNKPAIAPGIKHELDRIRDKAGMTSVLDKQKELQATLPAINRVQSVSIEDYEAVKKMWKDTYEKLDPPKTTDGKEMDRKEWIKEDIEKVTLVTNLLSTGDTEKIREGMDMVAKILPFLLIGGFSQTEVLAYLKAKQEAAKEVLEDTVKKSEDEDTMVNRSDKKEHEEKEMQQERVLDEPKEITEGDKKVLS